MMYFEVLAAWPLATAIVVGSVLLWVLLFDNQEIRYEPATLQGMAMTDALRHSRHRKLILPPSLIQYVTKPAGPRFWERKEKKKTTPATRGRSDSCAEIDLPEGCRPLLAFVNSKSGGGQGRVIKQRLYGLLCPAQVVDLSVTKPEEALRPYRRMARAMILVCGGDGTVGWILSAMSSLGMQAPVSIMPLGTGNDLARQLGWGGGWEGESIADILADIVTGHIQRLDRWSVKVGDGLHQPQKNFTNYYSVGADAGIALRFHKHRQMNPKVFFSRLINKVWYMRHGVSALFLQLRPKITLEEQQNLTGKITVVADGKEVRLPRKVAGVIVSNIGSYGGGATTLWPGSMDGSDPVDIADGMLEVTAVTGVLHLTQIQLGIRSGLRLARCKEVKITTTRSLPMQLDGEPWLQPPCETLIKNAGTCNMLCRTTSAAGRVLADVGELLEWAVDNKHISPAQAQILEDELERRETRRRHSP
ncbi:Diacylglycerol kinase 1 [Diplonema papillatum]|nr:Diacylglycerol kinase 1 [Diplonema papillatum]